ncbi:MAG: hypothetical protein GY913_06310 [Proteobacteria bacterium]|nr:hypothetical protein [Pseudomonadota bacterium]MCP4916520.1 hypothetical protein [Pseudomonadota bacterium]
MLLLALACTKDEPLDSSAPSECGRLSEYPDTEFAYEPVEWPEGRSLFGPEPPDQVHDAPDEWATFLDVHGRTDPVPDMDWEGKDVLLWVGEYIACDRRTYDWPESFVVGEKRTVLGFYEGDDSCDSLVWQEAWVFIADEVDDAPDGDACVEPEASR